MDDLKGLWAVTKATVDLPKMGQITEVDGDRFRFGAGHPATVDDLKSGRVLLFASQEAATRAFSAEWQAHAENHLKTVKAKLGFK